MIGETRAEALAHVGVGLPTDQREALRGIAGIFLQRALGDDDGRPLTQEDADAVLAAFETERHRLATEGGYASVDEAMEAVQ